MKARFAWTEKLRTWIDHFMCDRLNWHNPNRRIGFNGSSLLSCCKHCNRTIMMDSQGNWFAPDRSEVPQRGAVA